MQTELDWFIKISEVLNQDKIRVRISWERKKNIGVVILSRRTSLFKTIAEFENLEMKQTYFPSGHSVVSQS